MMNYHSGIIQNFLHYGYIPDPELRLPDSINCFFKGELEFTDLRNRPESDLIKIGAETLRACFKDEIRNDQDKIHIVPLSEGLDSRTILVNLREQLDPSAIITVTFGYPGSCVFRTARSVAKKAGVRWEFIDLSEGKRKWSNDLLLNSAKLSERPTRIFDSVINHAIQLRFGKDCIYWSGFMGDSLSRINPVSYNAKTWEQAKMVFSLKNKAYKNHRLTSNSFSPEDWLPSKPYVPEDRLDYYSQLNFCIRQQCFTMHIYSPKGYVIRYPFLNSHWIRFILNVPVHYRHHQVLYRKIQGLTWPRYFNRWNTPYRDRSRVENVILRRVDLNIKKIFRKLFPGVKPRSVDRNLNYIDWLYASHFQDDFKEVILSNLIDLKARNIIPWLDIEELITTHQKHKKNLIKELMLLVALEIHLKAETLNKPDVQALKGSVSENK
jgi:hypothetical protein